MTIYYQDNFVYIREKYHDRFYLGMCYDKGEWIPTGLQFDLPHGVKEIEIDCEIDWNMNTMDIRKYVESHLPIELLL